MTLVTMRGSLLVAAVALTTCSAQALQFVPGDIYTTTELSPAITQYGSDGAFKGSMDLNASLGREARGLTFGPNGLMYAVTIPNSGSGFSVHAINGSGVAQETYQGSEYAWGNSGFGKISFGNNSKFYVCAQDSLTAFTQGNPVGTSIYSANSIFDAKVLPSGNLLVLSAYALQEITPTGTLVRDVVASGDLVDARGLEYDPQTNSIFVTMLGYSGNFFQLMKLDGTTGQKVAKTSFWYGNDITLTFDRQLLVGSWTQSAGLFDLNLNQTGTLGTSGHAFVSQMPVPEPSIAFAVFAAGFALRRRSKSGRK